MEEGGQNGNQIPVTTKPDFSINDIAPARPSPSEQATPANPFASSNAPDTKPNLTTSGSAKPKKSKKTLMTLLLSVVVILIFVGGIYGVYSWQHKKVNGVSSQIANLNFQNQTYQQLLNKDKAALAAASSSSSSSTSSTPATTNSQYLFKISQLDVELTLPATLADVTSQANTQNTLVNLSTQSLTDLDATCAANATKGEALGDISKASGKFVAKTGVTLVKQFSNDYITYTAPASSCSTVAQVNTYATDLETALKSSFSSIQATSQ